MPITPTINPINRAEGLLDSIGGVQGDIARIQTGMIDEVVTEKPSGKNLLLAHIKRCALYALFGIFYTDAIQSFGSFLGLVKGNQSLSSNVKGQ